MLHTPEVICDDLPKNPCAQMGALAMGLLVLLGALLAALFFWLRGGALLLWPAFLSAFVAALIGSVWGLWARSRLLAGRPPRPLLALAAFGGALGGLLLGILEGFLEYPGFSLLRVGLFALFALLGGAWTASGVRRIAMTC